MWSCLSLGISKRVPLLPMSCVGGRPLHYLSKSRKTRLCVLSVLCLVHELYSSLHSSASGILTIQISRRWRAELPQLHSWPCLTKSTWRIRHVLFCRSNFKTAELPLDVSLEGHLSQRFIFSKESPVAVDGARGPKSVLERDMRFWANLHHRSRMSAEVKELIAFQSLRYKCDVVVSLGWCPMLETLMSPMHEPEELQNMWTLHETLRHTFC